MFILNKSCQVFFFPPSFLSICSQTTLCGSYPKQPCWDWSLCSEADLLTNRPHCPPMFLRTKTLVYDRKLCVDCNVNLQKRNPELRGTKHSITCSGHVCSSLQKETLPLSSKVVCYSSILEMTIWKERNQCLCSRNVQSARDPRGLSLTPSSSAWRLGSGHLQHLLPPSPAEVLGV